jgi:sulfatase-modifying factor enzyme 1
MRPTRFASMVAVAVVLNAVASEARRCPSDSVQVGEVCVDRYEASVWETTDAATINKIQRGKIRGAADLVAATQHGAASNDYGVGCPNTGEGCVNFYAVSVVGTTPSAYATWFQAAAACRNSNKRLATNQEWQMAALGTPNPGTDNGMTDCNVSSASAVVATGSRVNCLSDVVAADMVGNLAEWVADWVPRSTNCLGWGVFSTDAMCFAGADTTGFGPGALIRGGSFLGAAGVFQVSGFVSPSSGFNSSVGFRCARHP